MSAVTRLIPDEVLQALETMIARGMTGCLTFHVNRGMVQKIERTEYQSVPAVTK